MRRACVLFTLLLLGAAQPDARARLAAARQEAAAASARADALTTAAAREVSAARRAQARQRALASRVAASEATVRAAEARVAVVAELQAAQRARLAEAQAPAARLLAALTGLARRPAVAAVAQPGSLDDLVHVRAVLGTALPVVQARAAGVRAELAETRRLADAAIGAAQALRRARADLQAQRTALASLEAGHRRAAAALTRDAIVQSDVALAMGERARDLIEQLEQAGEEDARAADLADLPGPVARPIAPGAVPPRVAASAYRLPISGDLVTGLGEVAPAGFRSRGLTFAVDPSAPVVAPAAGTVRYAGRFRGYGVIVLIDHGDGWSSLLTGLARAQVQVGMPVAPGALLGRAAAGQDSQVTVELRRRGRPVDIAALLGGV
jgi:murein hydrolase activator